MENKQSSHPFTPTPSQGQQNKALKILVGLLAAVLLIGGAVGIKKYNDYRKVTAQLEEEKQALLSDLEELKINYEAAMEENTQLKDELAQAKAKVEELIAELENVKATDLKIIRRYKAQLYKLQKEREKLFRMIDSLKQVNQMLAFQKDSLGRELQELSETHQKVLEENQKLAETLTKAKTLGVTNVRVHGVRIKKSGKVIETHRAKRTQQIRVCYSVPRNPVVEPGDQVMYVQVINPDGDVIGSKDIIQVEGQEQIVSAAKEFRYDGQPLDICVFVVPETPEEIKKGDYAVNIYHNGQKVGEGTLTLK
ncbi:MAG: hypothetical protein GXO27_07645 [Chlorobi bacterium]|nr:hypothetical protein [Chlorobiota bacterium]